MSQFDKETLNTLITNFYKIKKRILQNRPISTKESKRNEYVELLIHNYNSIVTYTNLHFGDLDIDLRTFVSNKLKHCREILVRCFGKLNCRVRVPQNSNTFEEVDLGILTETDSDSDNSGIEDQGDGNKNSNEEEEEIIKDTITNIALNVKMASLEQKKSFIGMCASIMRENYDGRPLALESFLDKVNLIQELTDDTLTPTLITFIKSKLEGKAREALPENVVSIEEIKLALRNKIKPDNSKVVAGKIAALHVRNNNYAEFAKHTEELADALERSLVMEGMTKVKAHEMAIEQTVGVCRLNARSDLVKSILASTSFADPKDVVAKLVVEQTNESKEKQVLAFQSRGNNFSGSGNFSSFNRYRGNGYNRSNHGTRYSRGVSHYRGDNFNRHGYNNFHGNRGQFSYNKRGQPNYGNSSGNRNSSNNRYARTLTLNAEVPQQEMLGETNQD